MIDFPFISLYLLLSNKGIIMENKKKKVSLESIRVLDESHKKQLKQIIEEKKLLKTKQEEITESIKALSEKLGRPSTEISSWISLIMKEEAKGGAVQKVKEQIEMSEQFWGMTSEELEEKRNAQAGV